MNTEIITAEDLIVQSEGFLVSEMDGEKVMLNIESGKYYNLGRIGGRIWELAESPISVTGMVEQLVAEYEIEPDTCRQQVERFVNQLATEGLIRVTRAE
ncbi:MULTISPECIES: lasso peptide biosynthesis PqqD family chaperone [Paenibacillus]|uniref:Lasso peptide biosynthesis PqqD family chaperone n=1 Tax=Paenibacillus campinasensis TaxID=66347 RepID=A0ABW9SWB9_9BACL|nr:MULTISPECIES: lasso peptide biosynthesis PqqD family chaperone [Paenibacillus]MUG65144.1 lasso peptide biosynthesis PqqD family chaperone [Paenibacillus campinasensis]PAK52301.1 PqqD family protein [Paenibacillus sp. 7541]